VLEPDVPTGPLAPLAPLAGAVEALGRRADARAAEIEQLRRLPPDLSVAMADSGLGRAWTPARYGGLELTVQELLDAVEQLAYHDGSTAW